MKSHDFSIKIRKRCLELVYKSNSSHIGGAFSIADILSVLYCDILKLPPIVDFKERDMLFYSKGHACTALYSCIEAKKLLPPGLFLDTFGKDGSLFTTHASNKIPFVEFSSGSLGHNLSVAAGVAYSFLKNNINRKVYVILSDGELNEGSNWEALMFIAHHKLTNMTIIIDYNKIQSFGFTNEVLNLEPLKSKFNTFGFCASEIDGHDHSAILDGINKKITLPRVIVAHTIKGKGVSFMENKLEWHYKTPTKDQYEMALMELDK